MITTEAMIVDVKEEGGAPGGGGGGMGGMGGMGM
jgi:chaperonin GroEL